MCLLTDMRALLFYGYKCTLPISLSHFPLCPTGHGWAHPYPIKFSGMTAEKLNGSCWNFAHFTGILCTTSCKKVWPDQVRSRSYDISGTVSFLFFSTVFSANLLSVIYWNGDIMCDLSQKITRSTSDVVRLPFEGHPSWLAFTDSIPTHSG